jgi:hypothetical protein
MRRAGGSMSAAHPVRALPPGPVRALPPGFEKGPALHASARRAKSACSSPVPGRLWRPRLPNEGSGRSGAQHRNDYALARTECVAGAPATGRGHCPDHDPPCRASATQVGSRRVQVGGLENEPQEGRCALPHPKRNRAGARGPALHPAPWIERRPGEVAGRDRVCGTSRVPGAPFCCRRLHAAATACLAMCGVEAPLAHACARPVLAPHPCPTQVSVKTGDLLWHGRLALHAVRGGATWQA